MKTKLTLYVEEPVIAQAKSYAKRRKVPLSTLVEDHLRSVSSGARDSFVDRWRGQFTLPSDSSEDPRLRRIIDKHVR